MIKLRKSQNYLRAIFFILFRLKSSVSRQQLVRSNQSHPSAIIAVFKYLPGILFYALFPSMAAAQPEIESIAGSFSDKKSITIEGSGFTSKPAPAPLLWWTADEGITPSRLGRTQDWSEFFSGELTDQITADGSDTALRFDHGSSSGAALGRVYFDSDRIYLHRKVYDDFDITKNLVLSVELDEVSGTFEKGEKITGAQSGATGYVYDYYKDRKTVRFLTNKGSITQEPPIYFEHGEKLVGANGSGVNVSGGKYPKDILGTFNYKILRFWTQSQASKNNIWMGAQGAENKEMRITPEYTNNTIWASQMAFRYSQRPNTWRTEEVVYQASDLDTSNGLFTFIVDGRIAHDDPLITRTSEHPAKYGWIAQSQVSNGAAPNSWVYYDSLYVDDSWHRVIACDKPYWNQCEKTEPQIPLIWTDEKIEISVNEGSLVTENEVFIYIVNKDGDVNQDGYQICLKCPVPVEINVN